MIPACHCGAEGVVLYPGSDSSSSDLLDMMLTRPVAGVALCAEHGFTDTWRASFAAEQTRAPSAGKEHSR